MQVAPAAPLQQGDGLLQALPGRVAAAGVVEPAVGADAREGEGAGLVDGGRHRSERRVRQGPAMDAAGAEAGAPEGLGAPGPAGLRPGARGHDLEVVGRVARHVAVQMLLVHAVLPWGWGTSVVLARSGGKKQGARLLGPLDTSARYSSASFPRPSPRAGIGTTLHEQVAKVSQGPSLHLSGYRAMELTKIQRLHHGRRPGRLARPLSGDAQRQPLSDPAEGAWNGVLQETP